jgi:two-component system chemotaxis response regulator CheY
LKILVIDDSNMALNWYTNVLEGAGHSVHTHNPEALYSALGAIHQLKPHLVITDFDMARCNGESLLRAIREDVLIRDTAIMVFSAQSDPELIQRLSRWNLAGFLVKPATAELLLARVQEVRR